LHTEKKINVIYNFINEKEYYKKELSSLKKEYGIHSEERVVIHISNFRKVKRIEDVIYTFQNINQELNVKLLLVGDELEFNNIFQLVHELGLDDNVLYLGKQKNITELLS